jgi:hypothetical protein
MEPIDDPLAPGDSSAILATGRDAAAEARFIPPIPESMADP